MPFSLTVLFLGRFDPFQGFVTSSQLFVRSCHDGVYSMLGPITQRKSNDATVNPHGSSSDERTIAHT
jgi:hypothetical protein